MSINNVGINNLLFATAKLKWSKPITPPAAQKSADAAYQVTLSPKDPAAADSTDAEKTSTAKTAAPSANDGETDTFKDAVKALEIARRIAEGDKVPPEDEEFLLNYDSKLYMSVKSIAAQKEDPHEYDSLLEDEESADADGESIEAADVAAPAPVDTADSAAPEAAPEIPTT